MPGRKRNRNRNCVPTEGNVGNNRENERRENAASCRRRSNETVSPNPSRRRRRDSEKQKVDIRDWLFPSMDRFDDEDYIDAPIDPKKSLKMYKEMKTMGIFLFLHYVQNTILPFLEIYFVKSIIIGIMWAMFRIQFKLQTIRQRRYFNASHVLGIFMLISILQDVISIQRFEASHRNPAISFILSRKMILTHFLAYIGGSVGKHEAFLKNDEYVGSIAGGLIGLTIAEIFNKFEFIFLLDVQYRNRP